MVRSNLLHKNQIEKKFLPGVFRGDNFTGRCTAAYGEGNSARARNATRRGPCCRSGLESGLSEATKVVLSD